jgi:hypothetical protein
MLLIFRWKATPSCIPSATMPSSSEISCRALQRHFPDPDCISDADWAEYERLEAESRAYERRYRVWEKTHIGPPRSCTVCGGTGLVAYGDRDGPCLPCGGSGRDGLGAVYDPDGPGWC